MKKSVVYIILAAISIILSMLLPFCIASFYFLLGALVMLTFAAEDIMKDKL